MVQQALNNVAVGRTMVVIAHRLSTIRKADNIVVMSYGEIVEQGTHNDLIAQGGKYAKLVQAQTLTKGSEDEPDSGGETQPTDGLDRTHSLAESRPGTVSCEEQVPGTKNYG